MTAEISEEDSSRPPAEPSRQSAFDQMSTNWWEGGDKVKIGQTFLPRKI